MRILVILSIIVVFATGCSKNEVEKTLADQVTGSYEAKTFSFKGTTFQLPIKFGTEGLAFEIVIKNKAATMVDIDLVTITTTGAEVKEDIDSYKDIMLVKTDAGSIEMMNGSDKLGFYQSNSLTFELEQEGEMSVFSAIRK